MRHQEDREPIKKPSELSALVVRVAVHGCVFAVRGGADGAAFGNSSSSLAAFLSLALVSRGGSWSVSSAAMPACSWRPRSISASSSAPNSSARLVIHSHSRKTMTPASEP